MVVVLLLEPLKSRLGLENNFLLTLNCEGIQANRLTKLVILKNSKSEKKSYGICNLKGFLLSKCSFLLSSVYAEKTN